MDLNNIQQIQKNLSCRIKERCKHLITLVDNSPYSKTFGCFDRSYWHYKIKDFPSGMSQESIYPLALALKYNSELNLEEFSHHFILDIIRSSYKFSLNNQHKNGSVDDYFPFEQAAGATAFSAYAIMSAIQISNLSLNQKYLNLLKKRIYWLSSTEESGKLSNHEALICLVLSKGLILFEDYSLKEKIKGRFQNLLSLRNNEGWFQEYGGFDIGYETFTFSFLFELQKTAPFLKEQILEILSSHIKFMLRFIEPDGCIGGELFSRGTYNIFFHGLLSYSIEFDQSIMPKIIKLMSTRYLELKVNVDDDYLVQHHLWSDMKTLILLKNNYAIINKYKKPIHNKIQDRKLSIRFFSENSGHIFINYGDYRTHISCKMGGLFRFYKNDKFVFQDTQNVLKIGKKYFLANFLNENNISYWANNNEFIVKGHLTKYSPKIMTTLNLILLRFIMAFFGKYKPNFIRKLMQRILIKGHPIRNREFIRKFIFKKGEFKVIDSYKLSKNEFKKSKLIQTNFSIFKYVVMSKFFNPYSLLMKKPSQTFYSSTEKYLILTRVWEQAI